MPDENSISRRAVSFVMEYEKKRGNEVIDVQTKSKFKGCDVLSFSPDKKDVRVIEVKGTAVKNWGIPDLFENELTRTKKLIATHLYLVKFSPENREFEKLFIIPAKEFKSDDFDSHLQYSVKSNFYTRNSDKSRLDKFEEKIE